MVQLEIRARLFTPPACLYDQNGMRQVDAYMSSVDLSPLPFFILYPLVGFDFIAIALVNSLNGTS